MAGAWRIVKDSLIGKSVDLTREPIGRAVVLLAIPMVLETLLESVFAVVDIFWVSRLGPDATTVVGVTESLMAVLYAMAIGMTIAATAMVARRVGEKDPEQAAVVAVQAIFLGVAIASLFGIVGVLGGHALLGWMGVSPGVLRHAAFTRVMLGGNVTVFLLYLINAAFRGAGDAAIAMWSLSIANAFNILLGPLFIFGVGPFPRLGVTGAAVGTTIGRGIGVAFQLAMLLRGGGRLTVKLRHVRIDVAALRALLRLAGNGVVQAMVGTTSWLGMTRLLTGFGDVVVAGYTVGIRIVMFALLPAFGLANAAATLVGQNLGAERPERAEQSVWIAARFDVLFLGAVGIVLFAFPWVPVAILTPDPAVVDVGARFLRIVSVGFPFYAFAMVMESAFNGAGDTWTPTWLNFLCFWCWEIPLAWLLTRFPGVGATGAFIAITVAFSTVAVAGTIMFRRGKWKRQRV
jgi:MATE family, multidrug efflux pump